MSNVALNAVFERSKSKGIARLVLLSIADRSDASGIAWCGASDIASRANISRQNVARAVKELCEQGELGVEYRKGPKCCNVYKISDSLKARQSQGETVSLRSAGSLKVRRRCSQGETQTPRTQRNPNKGANRSRFDTESVPLPFQSEKFSLAWRKWVKHRKEIGHPLTPTANASAAIEA